MSGRGAPGAERDHHAVEPLVLGIGPRRLVKQIADDEPLLIRRDLAPADPRVGGQAADIADVRDLLDLLGDTRDALERLDAKDAVRIVGHLHRGEHDVLRDELLLDLAQGPQPGVVAAEPDVRARIEHPRLLLTGGGVAERVDRAREPGDLLPACLLYTSDAADG